jgi:hypothetical protein
LSLRFQADADLKRAIVTGVRQREPSLDFASANEAGLERIKDPELLERAAQEGRILVSHDRRTMLAHFRARLEAGKSSPGLFVVSQGTPVGRVVEAIVFVWSASDPDEWRDQIYHLPALLPHIFTR